MGKRVLLTAFTHTAVDNVLLRLGPVPARDGLPPLGPVDRIRMGDVSRVHMDVRNVSLEGRLLEAERIIMEERRQRAGQQQGAPQVASPHSTLRRPSAPTADDDGDDLTMCLAAMAAEDAAAEAEGISRDASAGSSGRGLSPTRRGLGSPVRVRVGSGPMRDVYVGEGGAVEPLWSPAAVRDWVRRAPVVAVTCLGARHALLEHVAFDLCVVDEASQLTEPTTLIAVRQARTFCLVGDHCQLPPLVAHDGAAALGMSVSLFARLAHLHPSALFVLSRQYRMAADIAALANDILYARDGSAGLVSANDAVAAQTLRVDPPGAARVILARAGVADTSWLGAVLLPQPCVAFLNTDSLGIGLEETQSALRKRHLQGAPPAPSSLLAAPSALASTAVVIAAP